MLRPKLPADVLEFFREQGSIGGKKAAASMTAEQRVRRAVRAAEAMTPEERRVRAIKAVTAREVKRQVEARQP